MTCKWWLNFTMTFFAGFIFTHKTFLHLYFGILSGVEDTGNARQKERGYGMRRAALLFRRWKKVSSQLLRECQEMKKVLNELLREWYRGFGVAWSASANSLPESECTNSGLVHIALCCHRNEYSITLMV